ncbi:glycoside hydrolase family 128 protein [Pleomassaria siparia CBS 279.74]|uniref:Glycoside hydrolase family 128 protein n=1 Tax=Pleomassaria siparia CBS 279.74 TaxID=1314801 RepID=A0A6G1KG27_9PLEO|nr:glycoside hydrolase family 128 protein [Pleomassaria siparia CBS 279.74]
MRVHNTYSAMLAPFILLASAPLGALASDILKTNGYSSCQDNSDITVNKLDLEFDKDSKKITFDVSGSSQKSQKVMATLVVNAYGKEVYKNSFNPCDSATKMDELCPVPSGTFAAKGVQSIPDSYISAIPAIAFNVPDLDSQATMQLTAVDGGAQLACITSTVGNGKTLAVAGVSYVAAGIAGAALAVSGLSALASAGTTGAAASSPTFGEVIGWFQSMALNGMMSVQYPSVYQSFSKNFAFSTGLVYWEDMQVSIDGFRAKTNGNLTEDSVAYLKNATLIHTDQNMNYTKRSLDTMLWARDGLETQVSSNTTTSASSEDTTFMHQVKGIQGYVEELSIPDGNTFMTVLIIFAIVVAAITVGILLFKVILESWALCGNFPKRLTNFRKRYWWTLAKTITNLVLLLYGIWTLYCVYQFKSSDSWAAMTLAGVTLALFTGLLAFFSWKIWSIAQKFKNMEGDSSALYEDKEVWRKYSMFYENYKKSYWWIFIPIIVYTFARGCVIAGASDNGLVQVSGQLIVESLLLILLLWVRPFSMKSGNWINMLIQIVRVLSVVCILVFVEELGVAQTTKTVTGLILVVMQAVLTALLAILIVVNAIVICCRDNPHRKKRKEAEKARDLDNLTPLDARNSLLMDPQEYKRSSMPVPFTNRSAGYDPVPLTEQQHDGRAPLLTNAASIGALSHTPSDDHGRTALLTLATATVSSKRGLCHVPSKNHPTDDNIWSRSSDLTWYYNYQSTPSSAYLNTPSLQFVPMLWGSAPSSPSFLDSVTSLMDAGTNITYVLGFNEPDGTTSTGGSNIPANDAAKIWKEQIEPLKEKGLISTYNSPVHWYGDFEGLASHVGQVMGTYPNWTIWVTEWALPNQKLTDTQAMYNTTAEWFDRIEYVVPLPISLPPYTHQGPILIAQRMRDPWQMLTRVCRNITHYSYFGAFRSDVSNVGPNAAMLTQKGQLTDIGSWYLGGSATNSIPKGGAGRTVGSFAGWMLLVGVVGVWGV